MSDTNEIKPSDTKIQNKNISNEISKEVDAHIWKWITRFVFLGAILGGILGFFGVKEVDRYIRRHIEKSIDKSIDKTVKEEYDRTVREQRIFILNWQLEVFKKEADETGNYNLVLEKIKPNIEKTVKTEDEELIIGYIDTLISFYFQAGQYKEIFSIVKEYEKDFSFSPTGWATVAIANMDLYELYGSKEYKKASIKAADNALEQLPGYGSAQAVKLLIYIIDYDKEKSDAEKEEEQKTILRTLEEVNSGSVPVTSYETIDYIKRAGEGFSQYVDKLFEVFPAQMKKMEERYNKYYNEYLNIKN